MLGVDEHQWLAARIPKEVGDIDWDMHGNLIAKRRIVIG
jgi:hypothetical protein